MKRIALLVLCVFGIVTMYAQTWQKLNAISPIGASYLIAACNLGDNIMVIGNNQRMGLSIDKGVTWTYPSITSPPGQFVALYNGGDRIYANMKISTYDFELYYTLDNGTTWTKDIVGLPQNIPNTGKLSMRVKHMGNGYLMAYDGTKTCYKQIGAATWTQVTVSTICSDVASLNGVWYVLGQNDIMISSDQGVTWTPAPLNGLPSGNGWFKIATNGVSRLFLLEAPANGGDEVYFSDDFGASWTLTNSAGHYAHANAWLGFMYAVNDYVFAAVSPSSSGFTTAPPYLMTSATVPNFQVGDTSGLYTPYTTSALPVFFHIDNKLFTMNWDLLSSTPGFSGTLSVGKHLEYNFNIYPNPTNAVLYMEVPIDTKWRLISLQGKMISEGTTKGYKTKVNIESLENGIYFIQTVINGNAIVKKVVKY